MFLSSFFLYLKVRRTFLKRNSWVKGCQPDMKTQWGKGDEGSYSVGGASCKTARPFVSRQEEMIEVGGRGLT